MEDSRAHMALQGQHVQVSEGAGLIILEAVVPGGSVGEPHGQ